MFGISGLAIFQKIKAELKIFARTNAMWRGKPSVLHVSGAKSSTVLVDKIIFDILSGDSIHFLILLVLLVVHPKTFRDSSPNFLVGD
jgi:hypothetical protein